MPTTQLGRSWSLFDVFEQLLHAHPAMTMGRWQSRASRRRTEDILARMQPHLREDLGLPPIPPPEPEHPALARARRRASRWGS